MDYDGNTLGKSLSFANNLPGTLTMVDHLNSIMEKDDFEKLTIGMFSSSEVHSQDLRSIKFAE